LRSAKEAGIIALAADASIAQATDTAAPSRLALERVLIHFGEVVERSARELEPHYVTTYITEVASLFNSWYANDRVIGGSYPSYGVLLAQAAERTLRQGLYLLGIPVPEEM
jgi:arginyl-tRNA synthetase